MVLFKRAAALLAVVTALLCGSTSLSEAGGDCSSGFLDLNSIDEGSDVRPFPNSSLPPSDRLVDFNQWVFPNLRFTCDGSVTSWRLMVRIGSGLQAEDLLQIPQITTWRLSPNIGLSTENYMQYTITNITEATVEVGDGYIEYTPTRPTQVKAGDFVGIEMPTGREFKEARMRVRPLFLTLADESSNATSCLLRVGSISVMVVVLSNGLCLSQEDQQSLYIPLISATFADNLVTPSSSITRVSLSSTPATPSIQPDTTTLSDTPSANSTATLQDTQSTDFPTMDLADTPQLNTNSGQLIGVIVGALLAAFSLVLIVILVAFLVIILAKRRGQKLYDVPVLPQPQNMDNPVYTAGATPETNGVRRTKVYATPSPTQLESPHPLGTNIVAEHYEFSQDVIPASYEQPLYGLEEPAYQSPEYALPFISRNATLSQPYEVPLSALSTLVNTKDESSLDRHTYSVLEAGIYVPTEEERQLLHRPPTSKSSTGTSNGVFDEDIYAKMSRKYKNRLDDTAFFEQEEVYWKPASSQRALYQQLAKKKYREILRPQIQIIKHLGAGQFGTVSKGVWESPSGSMEVAVKMLQPQASDHDKKVKFLQEAAIMGQFLHPNIVKLHGVVTVNEPVMIVLEYMTSGDLRDYLIALKPKDGEAVSDDLPQRFLKFCREISSGMNYLSNKAFVHRDLAARNILVSDDDTCKIGDFGMSRDLEDNSYYITHGGKIPVKWTAPEALHFRKYSTASDVWSFGCVMYEIWSLGHKPFEAYSNIQAMQMIGSGYRLPPPPGCPKPLYSLMIRCWHSDASNRPLFSAIFKMLNHLDSNLLSWSEKDKGIHPQASILGASLVAGEELYTDLQDYYLDEASKRQ